MKGYILLDAIIALTLLTVFWLSISQSYSNTSQLIENKNKSMVEIWDLISLGTFDEEFY